MPPSRLTKNHPYVDADSLFPESAAVIDQIFNHPRLVPNWRDVPWGLVQYYQLKRAIAATPFKEAEVTNFPSRRSRKPPGILYVEKGGEVDPLAIIEGCVIVCAGAYIGPTAQVSNSILLPEAAIPHGRSLRNSVVGSKTNIGDDFSAANTLYERAHPTQHERVRICWKGALVTLDSERLGALIGDGCSIGIRVSTMPGTIIGSGSWIGPNVCIKHTWPTQSRHPGQVISPPVHRHGSGIPEL